MPRQNRVTPRGEIVATPERGTLMGNRGLLQDAEGHAGVLGDEVIGLAVGMHAAAVCRTTSKKALIAVGQVHPGMSVTSPGL